MYEIMILVLDEKNPEEVVTSLGFSVWNVKKYSPHLNLGHCLSFDGSKVMIKFVYRMTWPSV